MIQDSMLTPEHEKNLVKIPESLLNLQDHFQAQVQFREKDNLPKCQCDFQALEFGQISMGLLELNLGFQMLILHL